MTKPHIILRLDAPMMSFGGSVNNRPPMPDWAIPEGSHAGAARFPSKSMLAGLIGNAFGYDRADSDGLQRLHDSLRYAAAIAAEGRLVSDLQIAQMDSRDKAWTTHGVPEGRRGAYGPVRSARIKTAWADAVAFVAFRIDASGAHDIDDVTAALTEPARPLFIGRKSYIPSGPLVAGIHAAATCLDAVRSAAPDALGYIWMAGEGPEAWPTTRVDSVRMKGHIFTAGGDVMHHDTERLIMPLL